MTLERWYVSGGIKGIPEHRDNFAKGVEEVEEMGYKAVNPLDIGACHSNPTLDCIHPGELLETGHTWQCYMRYDIAILVFCQGIYMLQGWEKSKGATEELRIAQGLGLSIKFQPKFILTADSLVLHG